MPKKKKQETQEEQSERFRKAVQKLIEDGELNPTEADEAVDVMLNTASKLRK